VGPRAGLDWSRKSCPPPGFDPRTVQPVAGLSSAVGRENNQKGFNTAMHGYAEYEILTLMMLKT